MANKELFANISWLSLRSNNIVEISVRRGWVALVTILKGPLLDIRYFMENSEHTTKWILWASYLGTRWQHKFVRVPPKRSLKLLWGTLKPCSPSNLLGAVSWKMGWDGLISLELISRSPSLEERENLKELFHSSWPNLDPSGTESSLHSRYLFLFVSRRTGKHLWGIISPTIAAPFRVPLFRLIPFLFGEKLVIFLLDVQNA